MQDRLRIHPRVNIQGFRRDHPIAMTKGNDNIIMFNTKRYLQTPLVIHRPGAGPECNRDGSVFR